MDEHSHPLLGVAVTIDEALKEEFEVRLVDSFGLVFRVAYSVLRHREDAEDVAQEVFAKAYRAFRQLRDRERFRAWVVRMTFRMALDISKGRHLKSWSKFFRRQKNWRRAAAEVSGMALEAARKQNKSRHDQAGRQSIA
jgi:RNA polymerase sigma factor (sigma-70 family)